MTRFTVTVRPHSSLFIGGYAASHGESDGDTANDRDGQLIPGSALKGALRESATRLVNGAGQGQKALTDLFGIDHQDGVIRVGPLRVHLEGSNASQLAPSTRHHVSLVRATRQAAPGRLFQNRVTSAGYGLCFQGEMEITKPMTEEEEGLLESARGLTDQIGGGRGRGLGLVEVTWERQIATRDTAPNATQELVAGLPQDQVSTMVLVLRAAEPVRLGVVKDRTNVESSKGHLDGSAVRGAVAAALSRSGSDEDLELVLGHPNAVVFGNSYPGDLTAVPAPLTLREPKKGGSPTDDALRLCAHTLGNQTFARVHDTCSTKGYFSRDSNGWNHVSLEKRMVTRASRNLMDGRAAEGRLFSLEILEARDLRFFVPVTGTPRQLQKVLEAATSGLLLGGARSRGLGRVELEKVLWESALQPISQRHERWCQKLTARGLEHPERTGVLLALGPLAMNQRRLTQTLKRHGLELVHGVSRRQAHGGWNSRARLPRTVASHFVPGSTFIVKSTSRNSALEALIEIENQGLGPGRPDGWGRLIACHPIHVDCFSEENP